MLVKIEEIQEPGLELKEPIKAEVLEQALAESEGFGLVSPGLLRASFKRVSGRVHVLGGFEATVKAPCRRCLKEVTMELPVSFSLRMIPQSASARDRDHEDLGVAAGKHRRDDDEASSAAASFELDEIDAEPFDGKTIDLDPVIREQVLLALPATVLCRDDCLGLCPKCGGDLNQEDCGHSVVKEVDARLAKLKDIKLNN